ncbi:glucosamine-6-phosphate deaminase [Bacillus shivajii]|uniref:glucosamine-6-phosphate deaminase n=1 Tax=Bacillus shivajii TaxID=1983719 RepID=UPI001CFAD650|nr:glucosamine-6-phosphate deaminase [Bacillus shivajii]UCZ53639.1 glucosamine-6-phosphate deaminase [Bacillus shivajii]
MKVIQVDHYKQMSEKASDMLFESIKGEKNLVLGLATGGTPVKTYEILTTRINSEKVDMSTVQTINLDEYIGLDAKHLNSYHQYMEDHFFKHVPISPDQTHLPNGVANDLDAECKRYEELIDTIGGVDIQLLGIGSNGHIGFNEPGTPFHETTHVVELAKSTREANARFFSSDEEVPTHAITMGIATIMKSKQVVLLASGKSKADALKQLIEGEVTESCPATVLQNHPNLMIIADHEALSKLSKSTLEQIEANNYISST